MKSFFEDFSELRQNFWISLKYDITIPDIYAIFQGNRKFLSELGEILISVSGTCFSSMKLHELHHWNLNMKIKVRARKSRLLEAQTKFWVATFFKRKLMSSSTTLAKKHRQKSIRSIRFTLRKSVYPPSGQYFNNLLHFGQPWTCTALVYSPILVTLYLEI